MQQGQGWIRSSCGNDIQRALQRGSLLHKVGGPDSLGECGGPSQTPSSGSLAREDAGPELFQGPGAPCPFQAQGTGAGDLRGEEEPRLSCSRGEGHCFGCHSQLLERGTFDPDDGGPECHDSEPHGEPGEAPAGDGRPQGGAPPEEGQMRASDEGSYETGESMSRAPNSIAVEKAGDSGFQTLSQGKARHLEEASLAAIPSLFQQLLATRECGSRRPVLMEIACAPDSLLTRAVQAHTGLASSATRCSLWNAGDLSTSEGLRLVLDRVRLEKPQHVWLSTPCGPFSPMQRVNQRNEQQQQALSDKRKHAMKIYTGAACVFRTCMQLGIHCTWEWAERSDAWRLPLVQRLMKQYHLHVGVTKGCRVQLRDSSGSRLLQKGWKIMSSHARLVETMNLPCKCAKQYQHGKCEGEAAERSAFYTPEYAKRVAQILCQELSLHAFLQECRGQSSLPETFGAGESCTCGETQTNPLHVQCGNCLRGRDDVEVQGLVQGAGDSQATSQVSQVCPSEVCPKPELRECDEALWSNQQRNHIEDFAQQQRSRKQYDHSTMEQLLQYMKSIRMGKSRHMAQDTPHSYQSFGLYSHGGQYGITTKSQVFPQTTKYINEYLKRLFPPGTRWTSFVVNHNNKLCGQSQQ